MVKQVPGKLTEFLETLVDATNIERDATTQKDKTSSFFKWPAIQENEANLKIKHFEEILNSTSQIITFDERPSYKPSSESWTKEVVRVDYDIESAIEVKAPSSLITKVLRGLRRGLLCIFCIVD